MKRLAFQLAFLLLVCHCLQAQTYHFDSATFNSIETKELNADDFSLTDAHTETLHIGTNGIAITEKDYNTYFCTWTTNIVGATQPIRYDVTNYIPTNWPAADVTVVVNGTGATNKLVVGLPEDWTMPKNYVLHLKCVNCTNQFYLQYRGHDIVNVQTPDDEELSGTYSRDWTVRSGSTTSNDTIYFATFDGVSVYSDAVAYTTNGSPIDILSLIPSSTNTHLFLPRHP